MESSTKTKGRSERITKALQEILVKEPEELERALQLDLEGTARESGAFVRKRQIRSAADLLRMVLMYVLSDWSLRTVAAWALLQEIGHLSDVAVLKRVRGCSVWLGKLVSLILQRRCEALQDTAPVRLRLMDASVITRPGAKGTDWRLHLGLSLWPLSIDGIEITDAQGGESLARFAPQAHEIRIADRGYAFVSGIAPLLDSESFVVIRINWQNLPLKTETGERLDLIAWLKSLVDPSERTAWLITPRGRFALRLIAAPLPPEALERARQHARRSNRKKKRQVSANTLLAAGFLLLITNLPTAQWPLRKVVGLYRLRWQIELAIKRLKSLIHIDDLRVQDPRMVQTYLLAKLLVALLLDELIQTVFHCQPDWFLSLDRPLSMWRLTQFFWESLRQWICGRLVWSRFCFILPALRRYFCDSPRARPQQLAWARAFLDSQAGFFSIFGC